MSPFPHELFRLGPFSVTDTVLTTALLSLALMALAPILMRRRASRRTLELLYEALEGFIVGMSKADVRPLVPLILTLWLFIGVANLSGLLPGVASPTRDLSLTAALAAIGFIAGHTYAFQQRGLGYLRQYIAPVALAVQSAR